MYSHRQEYTGDRRQEMQQASSSKLWEQNIGSQIKNNVNNGLINSL